MALTDNLIAAHELGSNGNDSHGSHHLTGTNSPTFTGTHVDLEAGSSQNLTLADNGDFEIGDQDAAWWDRSAVGISGHRPRRLCEISDLGIGRPRVSLVLPDLNTEAGVCGDNGRHLGHDRHQRRLRDRHDGRRIQNLL